MKSNDLGYNPPAFFWIATYKNGTALPQFDFESGRENLFSQVDQDRLDTFGWYPFTPELAQKTKCVAHVQANMPAYVVKMGNGEKLVAFKRQYIEYGMHREQAGRRTVYVIGYRGGPLLYINCSVNRVTLDWNTQRIR